MNAQDFEDSSKKAIDLARSRGFLVNDQGIFAGAAESTNYKVCLVGAHQVAMSEYRQFEPRKEVAVFLGITVAQLFSAERGFMEEVWDEDDVELEADCEDDKDQVLILSDDFFRAGQRLRAYAERPESSPCG